MELPLPQFGTSEDWGEDEEFDEEEGGEEGEEDDADLDAEAEEMARRLGDQLLADIAKAQLEAGIASASQEVSVDNSITIDHPPPPEVNESHSAQGTRAADVSRAQKLDAILSTMHNILSLAEKDHQVRALLQSQHLPSSTTQTSSIYDTLQTCTSTRKVTNSLAKVLSQVVLSLAQNTTQFPPPQQPNGQAKRTREEDVVDTRTAKRPNTTQTQAQMPVNATGFAPPPPVGATMYPDLVSQVSNAVHVVSSAISSLPPPPPSSEPNVPPTRPPDPAFVSSIHHPLHQIFLFSVTSLPRARLEHVRVLQEVTGLIQMLGILTNIPIGSMPPTDTSNGPGTTDIGMAIYPCLVQPCTKTFAKLYSLRIHQSRVHPSHTPGSFGMTDRPYKCSSCPASFLRSHDLKRHEKIHEKKAWKCHGCDKVFSRRDAIKRHQDRANGGKGALPGMSPCAFASIDEVEVDKDDGDEDSTRRAKMWNDIAAANQQQIASTHEEGELSPEIVGRCQEIVVGTYELLRGYVSSIMGNNPPPHLPPPPGFPNPYPGDAATNAPYAGVAASTPSQPPQPAPQPQSSAPPPMASLSAGEPPPATTSAEPAPTPPDASLSLSWLSEEQTKILEQAIAQAAAMAQAQAEAEAEMEQEEEEGEDDDEDEDEDEVTEDR
ncbi:hypothetical protein K474DRAFT_1651076 [Panus rudis PR-1116 ss-1]|nr:hypothetical protein K474DRAFT_1651076 [Panus rudis PR-1116 ss-1]